MPPVHRAAAWLETAGPAAPRLQLNHPSPITLHLPAGALERGGADAQARGCLLQAVPKVRLRQHTRCGQGEWQYLDTRHSAARSTPCRPAMRVPTASSAPASAQLATRAQLTFRSSMVRFFWPTPPLFRRARSAALPLPSRARSAAEGAVEPKGGWGGVCCKVVSVPPGSTAAGCTARGGSPGTPGGSRGDGSCPVAAAAAAAAERSSACCSSGPSARPDCGVGRPMGPGRPPPCCCCARSAASAAAIGWFRDVASADDSCIRAAPETGQQQLYT